jgi:hypothetical protein
VGLFHVKYKTIARPEGRASAAWRRRERWALFSYSAGYFKPTK